MRCSAQSSLLLLFLLSFSFVCAQSQTECLQQLKPKFETVRYRATIDVLDKHLSGLLIFKTQDDQSIRSVFVNEMGVTFFDVSFWDDHYRFHSMLPGMDKSAVKISLAKDLGMILMRGIFKKIVHGVPLAQGKPSASPTGNKEIVLPLKRRGVVIYFPEPGCRQSLQISNKGRKTPVVSIMQKYLPEHSMPDSIFVEHHRFHFTIRLKQLHAAE